jgi:hypothetical protein
MFFSLFFSANETARPQLQTSKVSRFRGKLHPDYRSSLRTYTFPGLTISSKNGQTRSNGKPFTMDITIGQTWLIMCKHFVDASGMAQECHKQESGPD